MKGSWGRVCARLHYWRCPTCQRDVWDHNYQRLLDALAASTPNGVYDTRRWTVGDHAIRRGEDTP